MQCMNTKLNFIKDSVNKFIKKIQGSNGLKEDSEASASILGSVSPSPDKRFFLLMKKREPGVYQPQWGNMRRNMMWFVRCQEILSAKGVGNVKASVLQET